MKKNYSKPELEVSVLAVEDIITTSLVFGEGADDSKGYVETVDYTKIFGA